VASLSPIEGTVAQPLTNLVRGTVGGAAPIAAGTACGESGESLQNSAMAELSGLISNVGSLSAQAQSLPLSVPTLPGAQQPPSYQPQATDYMQFSEDSN